MTEKDDFGFEEQPAPEEQQGNAAAEEEELHRGPHAAAPEKKGAPRRPLLLAALLLVLAGAAAYFYLGGPPAPETPPPAPAARQPIAVPPPPVKPEEAAGKAESVSTSPPSPAAPAAAPATPAVAPGGQAGVPARTEGATASSAPAPSPPPAPVAEPAAAPAKVSQPTVSRASSGAYSLQAGAFLLKANLREAEAKVRRLGYEPHVKTVRRTLPMTRLRVGTFPAGEGKARLASLKAVTPGAFLMRQGEHALLYAGSYQDLDTARRAADLLYQKGIRVEEETVEAELPLSLLSFGAFTDRAAAAKASERARAAGLEAVVRKDP